MSPDPRVVYRIDAYDRLVSVNDAWWQFARVNDGGALASPSVLGHGLWELIGGDPATVLLYSLLLDALRAGARTITFPFRCDAPGVRRLMQMTLQGQPDGDVEFRVDTFATSPRPPVALFDARMRHARDTVAVCSICARVDTGVGNWLPVEEATARDRKLARPWPPTRASTLCPVCLDEFAAAISDPDCGRFGSAAL